MIRSYLDVREWKAERRKKIAGGGYKKASACVSIVNSKFTQMEELHQKYKTEFPLSLAEKAKIVKVSKIQYKVDKRKTGAKIKLLSILSIEVRTSKRNHGHSYSLYYVHNIKE